MVEWLEHLTCDFISRPPRLTLGWVTVFDRTNDLGISPSHLGQLSILPSAGREMSTGQCALRLGNKGRYGSFHLWINVWVAGKTCDPGDPSLTHANLVPLKMSIITGHHRYF